MRVQPDSATTTVVLESRYGWVVLNVDILREWHVLLLSILYIYIYISFIS